MVTEQALLVKTTAVANVQRKMVTEQTYA